MKLTTRGPWFYVWAGVGVIALASGILAFQAWLLGIVLGWFGVTMGFWKCFLIVFLIGCLLGSSRSSKN